MCPACLLGLHEECFEPKDIVDSVMATCCCWVENGQSADEILIRTIDGHKQDEDILDPISTGRKRAAQLKPIIEGMTCEWANLLYAGGGVTPIIGCPGNKLTKEKGNGALTGNVHHGPDKSTLNNSDNNLHRICGDCHNRWHGFNDKYYSSDRPPNGAAFIPLSHENRPHDKYTLADPDQIDYSEQWWGLPPKVRELTPYREVEESV